jgi:hypothetical protein
MGYSRWDDNVYQSYASNTNLRSLSQAETFTSREMSFKLDPKKIFIRESMDSEKNPNSTPIIFGLDVTGSMGFLPEAMVKDALPKLMGSMYENRPVSDPHVMFMGIGDVDAGDRAPLQVSQFEADISLVEQLRDLYIERGGGGNGYESYHLPWYFATHLVNADAINKRGRKGYIFTMGDEPPPPSGISIHNLKRIFGEDRAGDMKTYGSINGLLNAVKAKFNVFHLIVEQGSYYQSRPSEVKSLWKSLLGKNAILLDKTDNLADVVNAIMLINEGANPEEVIKQNKSLKHAFSI